MSLKLHIFTDKTKLFYYNSDCFNKKAVTIHRAHAPIEKFVQIIAIHIIQLDDAYLDEFVSLSKASKQILAL